MNGRRISASIPILVLALIATGCNDDPKPLSVVVEGEWLGTVTERSDTCDEVVEPLMEVSLRVIDQGNLHYVEIEDVAEQECWVQMFRTGEDTLSWSGVELWAHRCNDGCTYRVDSTVTLEFHPGGSYTGTETLTFSQPSAECDHPDCQYPCDAQDRHMIFPPLGQACAFACETVYTWAGAVATGPTSNSCI